MKYYFTPSALKDMRGFEAAIQKRIVEKLDFYFHAQNPLAFAKPLRGQRFGSYRFRVGEYRIICDLRGGDVVVLTIGHRRDIYR